MRPHVEYASIVWSPHFKNEDDALEKVQRFALRVCLRQWNLNHEELLLMSRLPTLRSRRTVARLCQLYKILSDMTDFPNSPVEDRDISYSSRSVNSLSLVPFRFRTSLYQFPFFPHTITIWNKIVGMYDITDYDTVHSFKNFLYSINIIDVL